LRWSEIKDGAIHLPADRCKNGRAHVLPLTDMARQIIESVPQRLDRDHLFGQRSEGFATWSHARASFKDGIATPWTLHDLRRTCATGMAEIGIEPHIVEAVLNHVSGHKDGVAGRYNHAKYEQQIRSALLRWADRVSSIVEGSERKVIALRA
jgi:integrase